MISAKHYFDWAATAPNDEEILTKAQNILLSIGEILRAFTKLEPMQKKHWKPQEKEQHKL